MLDEENTTSSNSVEVASNPTEISCTKDDDDDGVDDDDDMLVHVLSDVSEKLVESSGLDESDDSYELEEPDQSVQSVQSDQTSQTDRSDRSDQSDQSDNQQGDHPFHSSVSDLVETSDRIYRSLWKQRNGLDHKTDGTFTFVETVDSDSTSHDDDEQTFAPSPKTIMTPNKNSSDFTFFNTMKNASPKSSNCEQAVVEESDEIGSEDHDPDSDYPAVSELIEREHTISDPDITRQASPKSPPVSPISSQSPTEIVLSVSPEMSLDQTHYQTMDDTLDELSLSKSDVPDIPPLSIQYVPIPSQSEYDNSLMSLSKSAWGSNRTPPIFDEEEHMQQNISHLVNADAESLQNYTGPFSSIHQKKRARKTISVHIDPHMKQLRPSVNPKIAKTSFKDPAEEKYFAKLLGGWDELFQLKSQIATIDRDMLEHFILEVCANHPEKRARVTDLCILSSERMTSLAYNLRE